MYNLAINGSPQTPHLASRKSIPIGQFDFLFPFGVIGYNDFDCERPNDMSQWVSDSRNMIKSLSSCLKECPTRCFDEAPAIAQSTAHCIFIPIIALPTS